jgi:hypothetical protein
MSREDGLMGDNIFFKTSSEKSKTVILRNQMGQIIEVLLLQSDVLNTEWEVSNLADGLYFFEIHDTNGTIEMLRWVKTR